MQKIKDQEQIVRTSFSAPRGILFELDEVGNLIKWHTRFDVPRSTLIAIAANVFYHVRERIDFEQIHDEATLRQELVRAIVKTFGHEPEPRSTEE
jgi:hypothetical protein